MKKDMKKNQCKEQLQQASKSASTPKGVVTDIDLVQQSILARLNNLESQVKDLSSDNKRKDRHIQSLQKQLHDVKLENKRLKSENKQLRSQLEKLSDGNHPTLNSQNSSTPPSKDTITNSQVRAKRTSSLREKSNRHVGGQPSHKGTTLHQSEHVDKVEAIKQPVLIAGQTFHMLRARLLRDGKSLTLPSRRNGLRNIYLLRKPAPIAVRRCERLFLRESTLRLAMVQT